MEFSVQDVLSLQVFENARLLCCEDLVKDREVKSISVIELPVEDFIRENEFILTTGIGYGQNTDEFKQFVLDVSAFQAAAVGIATGRHVLQIPQEVIAIATELQLPIIEIPWEIRFADIIHDIHAGIKNEQRKLLKRSNEVQEELLTLVLSSASLSEIADFIENKIELPLLIVDDQGRVVGRSQKSDSLFQMWKENLDAAASPLDSMNTTLPFNSLSSSLAVETPVPHKNHQRFLKLPIRSASEVQGYLIFYLPTNTPIDTFLPIEYAHILEHAATAAALCFLRINLIRQTEQQLRYDFAQDLLNNRVQSWESVVARARFLNYEIAAQNVCIVATVENARQLHQQEETSARYEAWRQGVMIKLENLVQSTGLIEQRDILTAIDGDNLLFLIGMMNEEEHVKSLNTLIDQFEQSMVNYLPEISISWGIGDAHTGPSGFHHSYLEAKAALDIGRKKDKPWQRTHFADVELHRALARLAQLPEVQKIVNSVLSNLLAYDEQKRMDLRRTLEVYLRHQGNVSRTSRQLNLHRQSLVYRLHRIESITGRSLVDPDDLFLLDLAIRLVRMKY